MRTGAQFSPCRKYRYLLWRIWNESRDRLCTWILLNPSTANENRDDPTIKRCMRRAVNDGWGGLLVVNLFGWRSTFPMSLVKAADPIGSENDNAILRAVQGVGIVLCGWGRHGKIQSRDERVLRLLREVNAKPYALSFNSDGTPKHPLYVPYSTSPVLMEGFRQ